MRQEKNVWEYLSRQVDLPDEAFPCQPLIEIIGNQRILIEHHHGVREYGSEKICVNVSYGVIQICGSCLHLRCMTKHKLVISGSIQSITLHRRIPK